MCYLGSDSTWRKGMRPRVVHFACIGIRFMLFKTTLSAASGHAWRGTTQPKFIALNSTGGGTFTLMSPNIAMVTFYLPTCAKALAATITCGYQLLCFRLQEQGLNKSVHRVLQLKSKALYAIKHDNEMSIWHNGQLLLLMFWLQAAQVVTGQVKCKRIRIPLFHF